MHIRSHSLTLPATMTAAVFAAAIVISGCSSENKSNKPILPADTKVIALGDSLTYGYGASPETSYPAVLAEMTRWSIINEGINGNTSADVLARTDQIISQNLDLVLLGGRW